MDRRTHMTHILPLPAHYVDTPPGKPLDWELHSKILGLRSCKAVTLVPTRRQKYLRFSIPMIFVTMYVLSFPVHLLSRFLMSSKARMGNG